MTVLCIMELQWSPDLIILVMLGTAAIPRLDFSGSSGSFSKPLLCRASRSV